jgi:precorrin-2 dehydrogenase/sirohydrochlorin ferrochelatase
VALFPMFLKLDGKPCLLVGAGHVGENKLRSLIRSGARVQVVSPQATPGVRRLASKKKIAWLRRKFMPRDLDGMLLVVVATSSPSVNKRVSEQARRRGALCNAVDDPLNCDFFYPAVVRRGDLQIAISTGGRSPELAHRLRKELQRQFGAKYARWVEELGRRREELLSSSLPPAERGRRLRALSSGQAFQRFARRMAPRAKR